MDFARIAFGCFALYCAWAIADALRTGVAKGGRGFSNIPRSTSPVTYWGTVATITLIGLVALYWTIIGPQISN